MSTITFTGSPVRIESAELPLILRFEDRLTPDEFITWAAANKAAIDAGLLKHGAILLKNIEIGEVADFDHVIGRVAGPPMRYVDGFSPRTRLTSSTYTSTEYDADFPITMHNELSYSGKWPSRLYFCCIIPCESGGETTLADCRKILGSFRPALLSELESRGVKYVRNLHAGGGAGPSWQQTYETHDKLEVENFCRENGIDFSWKPDEGIKLTQYRPAVIAHPVSGEKVWFNQVDQFHPSHLDKDIYEALRIMYGQEEDLPMYGAYGDGSDIGEESIREIRETVDGNIVSNPWEKGDLLIVDNILVCHGRNPYKGNRKIVVAMS